MGPTATRFDQEADRPRWRRRAASVGLLPLLLAVASFRMPMSTDQLWHEIAVGTLLVFSSPVELASAETRGIDTAVGEWHGKDLLVRTDYGLFADPLTAYQNRPGHRTFEERIDGQPARGVSFDQGDGSRFTAVHFDDLARLGAGPQKLTFVVISRGDRTAEEALRMTRSIRFRR